MSTFGESCFLFILRFTQSIQIITVFKFLFNNIKFLEYNIEVHYFPFSKPLQQIFFPALLRWPMICTNHLLVTIYHSLLSTSITRPQIFLDIFIWIAKILQGIYFIYLQYLFRIHDTKIECKNDIKSENISSV